MKARETKGATEGARLSQVNVRLPEVSIRQIAQLREVLGLRSDAAVITMALDRMARDELPKPG